MAAFGDERIHAVPDGGRGGAAAAGASGRGPRPGRRAGAVIDLGAPRMVRRVVFEIAEAEWVAEPSLEVSLDGARWERVAATASLADAVAALYADPRAGRGEVRFAPREARWVRLDPRVPARPPLLWVD